MLYSCIHMATAGVKGLRTDWRWSVWMSRVISSVRIQNIQIDIVL